MNKHFLRFTCFLLLSLTLPLTATAQVVDIPDPNLRTAVENALGKASGGTITVADMANLTELNAPNANISNLIGLEHATNLTKLNLADEYVEAEGRHINSNSVSDLSPLSSLTNLTHLWLQRNSITDISALAGLTNLTRLGLGNNNITDISPLSSLTNLTDLWLWYNNISDISVLAGLTNLTDLRIFGNRLTDISVLAGLTNLTRLGLASNRLTDISVLAGLTSLTRLGLASNGITDISAVSGLTNLTRIGLRYNNITDISMLAGLTSLTFVNLQENSVSDLSPLVANTGLGSGDEVRVPGNPLSYPSLHTHIPALQSRGVTVKFDNRIPQTLLKISGTVTPSDNLLIVEVRDSEAVPFEGIAVTFTVTSGGGTLSATTVMTDTNGRAQTTLTLGSTGEQNNVEASVAGVVQTVTFSDVPESAVNIPDPNLRAAIAKAIGLPPSTPILPGHLENLNGLEARNSNISDLTGLEVATNLIRLNLDIEYVEAEGRSINSNSVSDLSPLSGLTNLTLLNLSNNNIFRYLSVSRVD